MAASAVTARGLEEAVCGVPAVWQKSQDSDGELSGCVVQGATYY